MPLPIPNLDDRNFDDLVADLIARIPAHTPEWTHIRAGDPGRTLIELFAFLGDTLLYRVNQIPEKQRVAFLNLLGMPRRPALPARGLIALALPDDARSAVDLRARATIARPLPYEAIDEVSVAPVTGEVYLKRRLSAGEQRALDDTLGQLQQLYGPRPIEPYVVSPLFADGLAVESGIDIVADSVDGCAWIALLAPAARGGEDQVALVDAARAQLARNDAAEPRLLNVGVMPANALPDDQQVAEPRGAITLLWELSRQAADGATGFAALPVARDATLGTRKAGVVRLVPPGESLIGVGSDARAANERSGVGAEPPRLDDLQRQARLIAWVRVRPDPAAGRVGSLKLAWLGVHAVVVEQMSTLANAIVGDADGSADARIQLPAGNVDGGSLQIDLAEDGSTWERWERVDDLATLSPRSGRDARAVELDAQAGTLLFGDGVRGRVPATGARVRVTQLRSGGGSAGNLPPGTLKEISGQDIRPGRSVPKLKVVQPAALRGGADAESVADAEARISGFLRHRERAVTADDYRVLALQTPAASVGRVEVLPRFKPQTRQFDIPGVVSVMVLPARDGTSGINAPNPRADRPLIESVHAQLDSRRPLATELYVIGCEYVPLAVSVAVGLRNDAAIDETLAAVRAAIARLLWPLAPGGHDGQGWTLGRAVIDRELEVEAARVSGVATVAGVNLFARAVDGWRLLPRGANGTQSLALAPWQLPELLQVEAASGDQVPAAIDAEPEEPAGRGVRVAIPIVPEVC
jgi:Baseplate J-like protein